MSLKNLELMDSILRVSSGNQNVTIAKCLKHHGPILGWYQLRGCLGEEELGTIDISSGGCKLFGFKQGPKQNFEINIFARNKFLN